MNESNSSPNTPPHSSFNLALPLLDSDIFLAFLNDALINCSLPILSILENPVLFNTEFSNLLVPSVVDISAIIFSIPISSNLIILVSNNWAIAFLFPVTKALAPKSPIWVIADIGLPIVPK